MASGNRTDKTLYAAAAACVLLVLAGAGFRRVDAALSATDGEGLVTPDFREFPKALGAWTGTDIPMSKELVRRTDVDAHLNRAYNSHTAGGEVALFVGYGIRIRDLVPHRPSVCYPGAGWRMDREDIVEVPLPDGTKLRCSLFRFSRGGVDGRELTVLNYYLINGDVYPDVSYLRMNAGKRDRIRYVAQVQIASSDLVRESAERRVYEFARDAAAGIQGLLPTAASGESH